MAETDDVCTREHVLDLVVERGPVTAATIAQVLGLTTAAVRRHITTLQDAGDIAEHEPGHMGKRGRGRPARHYVATERGHELLPEGYSELATKALHYLGQVGGHDAVDSFATSRSREIERRYAMAVREAGPDARMRAQALADALTQDGYSATIREIGQGDFAIQLCQGHCPIQQVAENFPQLCDAETHAFSRLLGLHIQRLATLAGGGHVCTINIPVGAPAFRSNPRPVKSNR